MVRPPHVPCLCLAMFAMTSLTVSPAACRLYRLTVDLFDIADIQQLNYELSHFGDKNVLKNIYNYFY